MSVGEALRPRKDEADIHAFHALLAFGSHSGGRVKVPALRAAFDFEPGCAIYFPAAAMGYCVEAAPSGRRAVIRTYCDAQLGRKAMGLKYILGVRHPTLHSLEGHFSPRRLVPLVQQEQFSGDFWIDNNDL